MKKLDLSGYNLPTKIYWILMSCLSVMAVLFAAAGCFSFSAGQLLTLAISLVIAALVNQHHFIIPKTRVNVSVRKIFIFWGAVWLGVPGAVILAVVSSIVKYRLSIKDRNHWLLSIYVNVVSSFAAAQSPDWREPVQQRAHRAHHRRASPRGRRS